MSTESKKYRAEMRSKANRLANSKSPEKVDASSWRPGAELHADKKTGARPVRARIYKHGGKVQGDRAPKNAGKEPRGEVGKKVADAEVNRNIPVANATKHGAFHIGGFKKGGSAEKCEGGEVKGRKAKCGGGSMAKGGKAGDKKPRTKRTEVLEPRRGAMEELAKRVSDGEPPTRPAGVTLHSKGGKADDKKDDKKQIKTAIHKHDKQMHGGQMTKLKKGGQADSDGGRVERAKGGRTKGKTNINIIIGSPGGGAQPNMPPPQVPVRPPPPPPQALPPGPPPGMGGPPPGGPPPGPPPGGPPPGPPPGGPPGMPPPGLRAAGGRVAGYRSKDAGAGSGLGRLRKVHKEGQHTPGFRG